MMVSLANGKKFYSGTPPKENRQPLKKSLDSAERKQYSFQPLGGAMAQYCIGCKKPWQKNAGAFAQ